MSRSSRSGGGDARHVLYRRLQEARAQSTGLYPLSFPQLSIWYQQALAPSSAAYNMSFGIGIHSDLGDDVERPVRRALERVLERQAALRTVFVHEGDEPLQRVDSPRPLQFRIKDVSSHVAPNWESIVARHAQAQSSAPFDLERGPLYRFELLRVSPDLYALVTTFHHIVMDGWSLGVFLQDFACYLLEEFGVRDAALPELQRTYLNAALELRARQATADPAATLAYWRDRLSGAPSHLTLPFDYRESAEGLGQGANLAVPINAGTLAEITHLGRREGATPFMTILCAYYVLLARISGQNDIVLGVSVANRDAPVDAHTIGLFSDILPMRGTIDSACSFRENLRALVAACSADYDHADVPMARIIEAVKPDRSGAQTALFQAGFDFQNTPWPEFLENYISVLNGDPGWARLELNLSFSRVQDEAVALFEYSKARFTEATIQAIAEAFRHMLVALAEAPDVPIGMIPLGAVPPYSPDDFGADHVKREAAPSIVERIVSIAARQRSAIALQDEQQTLTYAELIQAVARTRCLMRSAGLRRGDTVGLLFGRECGYVVSLLAALMDGVRFCPLDEELPEGRLAALIEHAGMDAVIASKSRERLPKLPCARVLRLSTLDHVPDDGSTLDPHVEAEDAYLIYTSGTTGTPKCVVVSERALSAFCADACENFQLQPGDKVLQFASIGFDTSLEEILPALAAGATLVHRPARMLGSVEHMLEECARHGLSVLDLPTALWHDVVEALDGKQARLPSCVRLVIIGGEAARPDLVEKWQRLVGPQTRLLNTYGPTETTISVTCADLNERSLELGRRIATPIGKPNRRVRVRIVDPERSDVPQGLSGEICIGGETVAVGYLKAPELTDRQFIELIDRDGRPARYYRTGDIGRQLPDGSIEYRGRVDDQLKIRGHRIELSDVEALLRRCPAIADAVVLAEQDERRGLELSAFVLPCTPIAVEAEVNAWAQRHLPHFMRPSRIRFVSDLPRTSAGKIDRKALLELHPTEQEAPADAPRRPLTEVEAELAHLWSAVLGVPATAPDDDFFRQGGHSLLLIRLLSRIRKHFGVEISLGRAFAHPTLEAIADEVGSARHISPCDAANALPELDVESEQRVYPQSMAQQRLWFLAQLDPEDTAYGNPSATRIEGEFDVHVFIECLRDLVDRHEVLRSTFAMRDGVPVQVVAPPGSFQPTVVDLRPLPQEVREREIAHRYAENASAPFDLESELPVRANVLKLADDRHVVLFNWHHIATDAWSVRLFLDELDRDYQRRLLQHVEPPKPTQVQFGQYALWERQRLESADLQRQLSFWRTQLAGAPESLTLLAHGTQGESDRRERAMTLLSLLDGDCSLQLQRLAQARGTTLFVVCLAVFKLLLARRSLSTDIVVGTPISTRSTQAFENVIGYFINTLVMRTQLGGAARLEEVIDRVRATAIDAYANRDAPFEWVVREVSAQRAATSTPLFNVMFVLENEERSPHLVGEQALHGEYQSNPDAKFDLSLALRTNGGRLQIEWEARSGYVSADELAAMDREYRALLQIAATAPSTALDRLRIDGSLTSEQSELGLNSDPGPARSLWSRVEAIAHAQPDRQAVVAVDRTLDFQAFVEASLGIAQSLARRGVGTDQRVALLLERKSSLLTSIYGVWRAGAAYVPIDPESPVERIRQVLRLSGACLLLCQHSTAAIADQLDVELLRVDLPDPVAAQDVRTTPELLADESTAADLAYVLFTSGSTGEPKGVMVEHGQVLHFDAAFNRRMREDGLDPTGRWAANPPYTFDMSVFDFIRLAHGDTVYLLDDDTRRDPERLAAYLLEHAIDVIGMTPSQIDVLLNALPPGTRLPSAVVAGEPITPELWQRLVAHFDNPPRWAINLYGPTEATMGTTTVPITRAERAPTIGVPLPGYGCEVRDVFGALCAPGVAGELHIAGAGVARGYIGRADLTAARFSGGRSAQSDSVRCYASGDVVRWLPHGRLDYLGRQDGQVKVRGFRIELGEIECALRRHSDVTGACVLVQGAGANARLAGYVTVGPEAPRTSDLAESIRRTLAASLPAYMVPARIDVLEAFPLTSHGKLDRARLLALEPDAPQSASGERWSEFELVVADIWQKLLNRRQLRLTDNFFDLGGHSLLMVRLASHLEGAFGWRPSLRELFLAQDLAHMARLAARVDANLGASPAPSDVEEFEW